MTGSIESGVLRRDLLTFLRAGATVFRRGGCGLNRAPPGVLFVICILTRFDRGSKRSIKTSYALLPWS